MSIKSKKLKLIATATIVSLCATVVTTSTETSALPGIPRIVNSLRTFFGLSPKVPERTASLGPQSQPKPGLGNRIAAWFRDKFGLHESSTSLASTRPTPPPTPPMSSSGSSVLFRNKSDIVVDNDPYGQRRTYSHKESATPSFHGNSNSNSGYLVKLRNGLHNLLRLKNNNDNGSLHARNRFYKDYDSKTPISNGEGGATGGVGISTDNFKNSIYQNIDANGTPIGMRLWGEFPITDNHSKPPLVGSDKLVLNIMGDTNPPSSQQRKNSNYAVLNFNDNKGTLGRVVSSVDKKVEYSPIAKNDNDVNYNLLGAKPKVRTSMNTGNGPKKVRFNDLSDSSSTPSTSSGPLVQTLSSQTKHQPNETTNSIIDLTKEPKPVVPPKPNVIKTGNKNDKKVPPQVPPKPNVIKFGDGTLVVRGTSDSGGPTLRVVGMSQETGNKNDKKVPPQVPPKPNVIKSGDGTLVVRGTSGNGDPTFRVVGMSQETGNKNDKKDLPPVSPKKLKVRNVTQV